MDGQNDLQEGLLGQESQSTMTKQEEFTAFVNSLSANISHICSQVTQIEEYLPKIGTSEDSLQGLRDIKGIVVQTAKSVSLIRQYITQNEANNWDYKTQEHQYHNLSELALNAFDETRERFIEVSNEVVHRKKETLSSHNKTNEKAQNDEKIDILVETEATPRDIPEQAHKSPLLKEGQNIMVLDGYEEEEEARILQEIEEAVTLEVKRFQWVPSSEAEAEALKLEVSGFKPLPINNANNSKEQAGSSCSFNMKIITVLLTLLVLAVGAGIAGFLLIHR